MGTKSLRFGKPSPLLPDERLLLEVRRFRAMSSKSLPSYHMNFNLPLICHISLLVTNRRCLFVGRLFHFLIQEFGIWYPEQNPEDDPETLTSVCCTSGFFGRCLEIRSHCPNRKPRWLCSPDLTLRFFLKKPEEVEEVIQDAIGQSATGRKRRGRTR